MTNAIITAYQKKTIVIVGLVLLTLAIYWNVQHYGFINYDDNLYVTENDSVQAGLSIRGVVGVLTDTRTGNWHPLTMISHAVDWELFGQNAGGHHWSSLVLHTINTVLLFLLLNQMTGAIWRSALVAALFAIHPINVESVAWVSERKNVLSTFFWFLTMLFYIRYVKQPHWKRYLPVIVCFALGLMSKPMLVTLPFVLLLMDYWPLNRTYLDAKCGLEEKVFPASQKAGWGRLIWEKLPLFLLTVVFIFITLYAQHKENTIASSDILSLTDRIFNAVQSYALYIKKTFWPTDLAVFYPIGDVSIRNLLLSVSLLIVITIICCIYYKKHAYLAVGWFWFLGTLVPVIGLVQVGSQSMADRYAYVPMIGIFLMLVFGVDEFLKKINAGKMMIPISMAILAILMLFAQQQVQCWENHYILYTNAIEKTKPSLLPYKNLGLAMIDENKPEIAADVFRKAIELKIKDASLYNSLGVALIMLGRADEAEEQFKIALHFNPAADLTHNNLGMLYMQKAKDDEALKHFQDAIRLQPRFANAHYRLAVIFKRKGLNEKANYHYQVAIRINPQYGKMDF